MYKMSSHMYAKISEKKSHRCSPKLTNTHRHTHINDSQAIKLMKGGVDYQEYLHFRSAQSLMEV